MASSRMSTLFLSACTIIFALFMIDSAGCSSAPSSRLDPARNQIPRDVEESNSLTIMNTPSGASPSVPVASESSLEITKTVTVTSTQAPSTVTIFLSQIAIFASYNATNTTSQTQSPASATGMSSHAGPNILTNSTTLAVATATPPVPSAVSTTKKSPGNLSAHNPIAQIVKHLKTLASDSTPKKCVVRDNKKYGLAFWTGVITLSFVGVIMAPELRTGYKLVCRFL